jgi:hypothetical protein
MAGFDPMRRASRLNVGLGKMSRPKTSCVSIFRCATTAAGFACVALALLVPAASANWSQPAPGPLNRFPNGSPTTGDPSDPAIATIGGTPYVVYTGSANTLYVTKLSGSTWALVGNPSFLGAPYTANAYVHGAVYPSITGLDGSPYIAYQEWNEPAHINQIHVRTFDGANWVDVGSPSLNQSEADEATAPVIANVGGTLYVVWREEVGGVNQIFVKRWSGSAWEDAGVQPLNINPAHPAQGEFIIAVGGVPYVTWEESVGASSTETHLVYVERFAEGVWSQPVAGALNTSGSVYGYGPSIADVEGVPWVTWTEAPTVSGRSVYVKKLSGASWSQVDGVANPDTSHDAFSTIAAVGGSPLLGLSQFNGTVNDASVLGFDGSAWAAVGDPLKLEAAKTVKTPRLADVGGVPYAVWAEGPSSSSCEFPDAVGCQVYVKRFEPESGAPADTTAPHATLSSTSKKPQKLRPRVGIVISCGIDACLAVVNGVLEVVPAGGPKSSASASRHGKKSKRKRYKLKGVHVQIAAGAKKTVRLRIPRRALKATRKVLKHHGKARVRFTVRVSDASGNSSSAHKVVKLRR